MKFRKKPVVIDAFKFKSGMRHDTVAAFLTCDHEVSQGEGEQVFMITIPTLEGDMTVSNGDWIIKGVKGEFYPCKPDIFEMTYEKVVEE